MKKRIASVVAGLCCTTFLLAACTGGGGTPSPSSQVSNTPAPATQPAAPGAPSAQPSGDQPYALPLVTDGSVTITVATYDNPASGYSYTQDLPVWKKIEEDTGVQIEWEVIPASEYNSVMQTRLAAGTALPDFIRIPSNPMKYVQDGMLADLTDLIASDGYYTRQLYAENPYIKPFVTAPDGRIYFYTSDVAGGAEADPYVYYLRQDWLDKFNLEAPKTLDDWFNVWTTFLENDANGNGLRDEIPFTNDNTLIGTTIFGNAFGLKLHRSSGWNVNAAGQVEYDYIKPEMKELLTWLNKCYTAGLIDKEFSTQNFDSLMKKITMNTSGSVFRALNGLRTFNKALEDAGIDGKYTIVAPPVKDASSTTPQYVERYGPVSGLFAFTKDCKDLDIKFKFIDYVVASQPGTFATGFGIEGETYEIVDGKPVFTDFAVNNPDTPLNILLQQYGATPTMPWNRSLNGYGSYQAMASISPYPEVYEAAQMYQQYNIDNFPQGVLLTDDEQAIIGQYQVDIDTYRDEMITKFIMGTESLDNFDKYVDNIKQLGLDTVLQVRQQQWERYQAAAQN